jgi:hypothetical protein
MIITRTLGIVTTALALSMAASAQNTSQDQAANQPAVANAVLQTQLNTKTAKPGDKVTARLTNTVHVVGGQELPRGTVLVGHVDEVQPSNDKGVSKAVLTFDNAVLKNGQQVGLKSTLIAVRPEDTDLLNSFPRPIGSVDQEPTSRHGYELKSNIVDPNSGTLTADGKDFHLEQGTELQFAISPAANASSATGN